MTDVTLALVGIGLTLNADRVSPLTGARLGPRVYDLLVLAGFAFLVVALLDTLGVI